MSRDEADSRRPGSFFATCAKALEPLVAGELRALGASDVVETRAGVAFAGTLETAYRACLWSRVASRVLLPLATFDAADEDALYDGVRTIRWTEHLGPDQTLAVDANWALKVKDAIVDQIRDETGRRPSVDTDAPDVRINVYLNEGRATVSIDLSGDSLHRRGWRAVGVEAPLKENLAAAILLLADWPAHAAAGAPFVDPMCGSGTLPIEAALIAAEVAPGLGRERFGFHGWRGHDAALWQRLTDEARARRRPITSRLFGFDHDARAVEIARDNARRAGVADAIDFRVVELADAAPPRAARRPGGDQPALRRAARRDAGARPALRADRRRPAPPLHRLARVRADREPRAAEEDRPARRRAVTSCTTARSSAGCSISRSPPKRPMAPLRPRSAVRAEAFANRLRKNLAHLSKWANARGRSTASASTTPICSSTPSPSTSTRTAAHVQEYAPPATVDPARAEERLGDILALVPEVLGIAADRRLRQGAPPPAARPTQYGRMAARRQKLSVREGGHRFLVNLSDYLDTGLFLDHRRMRAMIEIAGAAESRSSTCSPTPRRRRSTRRPAARARR